MVNWVSNVFPASSAGPAIALRAGLPARARRRTTPKVRPSPSRSPSAAGSASPRPEGTGARPPSAGGRREDGKRVACVGAGPASLTGARPGAARLRGHGVRRRAKAGGFMRSQIPRFRLPESVIDEETATSSGWASSSALASASTRCGCRRAATTRCSSAAARAARPRDPRPQEAAANIHIGIDWLSRRRSATSRASARRVIVLGGGNTAMDCCRSARRLGADDVKVIVRSGFAEMKASPWEKEGRAARRHPDHQACTCPRLSCTRAAARRHELRDRRARYDEGPAQPRAHRRARRGVRVRRRAVAVGQENAFPWIERDCGIAFDRWGLPVLDAEELPVDAAAGLLRRRRGLRAEEHHHRGGRPRPRRGGVDRPVAARRGRGPCARSRTST